MDRTIFSWGKGETPIWNVMRERPPNTSVTARAVSTTLHLCAA